MRRLSLLKDYLGLFQIELSYKKETVSEYSETVSFLVSLLSDSNQRPRDYKSRALAN